MAQASSAQTAGTLRPVGYALTRCVSQEAEAGVQRLEPQCLNTGRTQCGRAGGNEPCGFPVPVGVALQIRPREPGVCGVVHSPCRLWPATGPVAGAVTGPNRIRNDSCSSKSARPLVTEGASEGQMPPTPGGHFSLMGRTPAGQGGPPSPPNFENLVFPSSYVSQVLDVTTHIMAVQPGWAGEGTGVRTRGAAHTECGVLFETNEAR